MTASAALPPPPARGIRVGYAGDFGVWTWGHFGVDVGGSVGVGEVGVGVGEVGVGVGGSVWMWGADKWAPHRDHWAHARLVVGSYFHDDAHVVSRSFTGRFAVRRLMGPDPRPSGTVRHSYLGRRGFGDSSRPSQLSALGTTGGISHRPLIWTHRVTMLPLPPLSLRVSTTTNEAVSAVLLHFAITLTSITSIPIL